MSLSTKRRQTLRTIERQRQAEALDTLRSAEKEVELLNESLAEIELQENLIQAELNSRQTRRSVSAMTLDSSSLWRSQKKSDLKSLGRKKEIVEKKHKRACKEVLEAIEKVSVATKALRNLK